MKQRGHEYTGKKRDTLIENISLGFSSVLGIAGVVAGALIPGATLPMYLMRMIVKMHSFSLTVLMN